MNLVRELHTLSNGLRVVLDRRATSLSLGLSCVVRVGSRDDYRKKNGLAHCVEHMLFRSKFGKNADSLFASFRDSGGAFDGITSIDQTTYYLRCLSEDAPLAIQTLSRIVTDLPLDKESLKAEQAIIAQEMSLIGE